MEIKKTENKKIPCFELISSTNKNCQYLVGRYFACPVKDNKLYLLEFDPSDTKLRFYPKWETTEILEKHKEGDTIRIVTRNSEYVLKFLQYV